VDVYATNDTDLVIDINGYFAPQASLEPRGVMVLDANNNVLGSLVDAVEGFGGSAAPNGVTVLRNGYWVNLEFTGHFFTGYRSAGGSLVIYWTTDTCSGNAYLGTISAGKAMGSKIVIYSGQANSFYVPSGSDIVVPSRSTDAIINSRELAVDQNGESTPGASSCLSTSPNLSVVGWPLSPFDVSVLGWTITGNPAHVAGPIKFQ
jgi:hypothetical protein